MFVVFIPCKASNWIVELDKLLLTNALDARRYKKFQNLDQFLRYLLQSHAIINENASLLNPDHIPNLLTLERASEIVSKLRNAATKLREEGKAEEGDSMSQAAIDMFCHFDDVFQLSHKNDGGKAITDFAHLCGYPVATNVRLVNEE